MRHDRIIGVIDEGPVLVQTVSQTLGELIGHGHARIITVAGGLGVEADNCIRPKTAAVAPVHHRRPRPGRTEISGIDGFRQFRPVHQVRADRVAPVHVVPRPAIRIMLITQMILAIVINHAVGIIQPATPGSVMINRAQRLLINGRVRDDGIGLDEIGGQLVRRGQLRIHPHQ